jgi:hypothetical protein
MTEREHRIKRETSTAKLPVVDTLIQSATVAVFHAWGVATAPLSPGELSPDSVHLDFPVGIVTFKAPGINAALMLSLPPALSDRLVARQGGRADGRDLLRELTNLVMGRLKNRLTLYQVAVTNNLPACRERMSEIQINAEGDIIIF